MNEINPYFKTNLVDYSAVLNYAKTRFKSYKKIRVAFFVLFEEMFTGRNVFEKMLQDDIFQPYIVVIPNTRLELNTQKKLEETYEILQAKYGNNVITSLDKNNNSYRNFTDKFDIIVFMNPYEGATYKLYTMEFWKNKALTIHFMYGFMCTNYCVFHMRAKFYTKVWKIYLNTNAELEIFKLTQDASINNCVVSGSVKMDSLAKYKRNQSNRKKIIIANHYSILQDHEQMLSLSSFLKFHHLISKIPKIYPDIDFIFRPHPLLIESLSLDKCWGEEKTKVYIESLKKLPNVSFFEHGDYLEIFAQSDAMIHDCGSYSLEYLLTKKPCCYMLREHNTIETQFFLNGRAALHMHYLAYSADDIINFINNVVIKGEDPKKEERENYAEEYLMVNYPNASDFVINDIKKSLGI